MLEFVEPAPSPALISLAQTLCPLYARINDLHISVDDDVFVKFAALEGKRTIICPNHPSSADAEVLFMLSAIVGEHFAFMTAREMFGNPNSIQLKWLQMLGCYSVERGIADMQAFKATRHLLETGTEKIVIFPEGEVSYQNEQLLKFQNGAELVALAALHKLKHSGPGEPIYILPLVLQYRYSKDIRTDLLAVIRQVETELGIAGNEALPFNGRIRHAYEVMIEVLERSHDGQVHSGESLDLRLDRLRDRLITEVQGFVRLDLAQDLDQICKIHLLTNAFGQIQMRPRHRETDAAERDSAVRAGLYLNQLRRATRLISVGEHNFDHSLSQEEAAELLNILVREVCKVLTVQKPDVVEIAAADTIDVLTYQSAFEGNAKSCAQELKEELEHRMSVLLSAVEHKYEQRMM